MDLRFNTGGREKYFKSKQVGDCVTRAITIANDLDYLDVYKEINRRCVASGSSCRARSGVCSDIYKPYLESMGWTWNEVEGSSKKISDVHMRSNELPEGTIICSLDGHLVTVIEGVINDTFDSSKNGECCVLGYYTRDDSIIDTALYRRMCNCEEKEQRYYFIKEVKEKLYIFNAVIERDDDGREILLGLWNGHFIARIEKNINDIRYGDRFRFYSRPFVFTTAIALPYGLIRNGILVALEQ